MKKLSKLCVMLILCWSFICIQAFAEEHYPGYDTIDSYDDLVVKDNIESEKIYPNRLFDRATTAKFFVPSDSKQQSPLIEQNEYVISDARVSRENIVQCNDSKQVKHPLETEDGHGFQTDHSVILSNTTESESAESEDKLIDAMSVEVVATDVSDDEHDVIDNSEVIESEESQKEKNSIVFNFEDNDDLDEQSNDKANENGENSITLDYSKAINPEDDLEINITGQEITPKKIIIKGTVNNTGSYEYTDIVLCASFKDSEKNEIDSKSFNLDSSIPVGRQLDFQTEIDRNNDIASCEITYVSADLTESYKENNDGDSVYISNDGSVFEIPRLKNAESGIYDYASLFTNDEKKVLTGLINDRIDKNVDIVVYTSDTIPSDKYDSMETTSKTARQFLVDNSFNDDSFICCIDLNNTNFWVCGYGIYGEEKYRGWGDSVCEIAKPYLNDGDFAEAVKIYINEARKFIIDEQNSDGGSSKKSTDISTDETVLYQNEPLDMTNEEKNDEQEWVATARLGNPYNYTGGPYRLVLVQSIDGKDIQEIIESGKTIRDFPYDISIKGIKGVRDGLLYLFEKVDNEYEPRVTWPVTFNVELSDTESVKEKGILSVGVVEQNRLIHQDSDGNWVGFNVDLLNLIANKLGVKTKFIQVSKNKYQQSLVDHTIDCVCAEIDLFQTEENEFDIVNPYLRNAKIIVMPKDINKICNSTDDLKQLLISIGGSISDEQTAKNYDLQYKAYVGQKDAVDAMQSGLTDAAMIDLLENDSLIGSNKDPYYVINSELTNTLYSICCRKGSDITDLINNEIEELYNNGMINKLAEKNSVKAGLLDDFDHAE